MDAERVPAARRPLVAEGADGRLVVRHLARAGGATVAQQMKLKDVTLETHDLETSGDTAYEVGEARLSIEPEPGKPTTATVKYVVVWKKTEGGLAPLRDSYTVTGR